MRSIGVLRGSEYLWRIVIEQKIIPVAEVSTEQLHEDLAQLSKAKTTHKRIGDCVRSAGFPEFHSLILTLLPDMNKRKLSLHPLGFEEAVKALVRAGGPTRKDSQAEGVLQNH